MNTKTAKRLRREANYHPKQPRAYQMVKGIKIKRSAVTGEQIEIPWERIELVPLDPRVAYLKLKKDYNNEPKA